MLLKLVMGLCVLILAKGYLFSVYITPLIHHEIEKIGGSNENVQLVGKRAYLLGLIAVTMCVFNKIITQ